jgi:hypothetical protein
MPRPRERLTGRASVRSILHALWLRGLQAPASLRYGVGIVAALVPSLLRVVMNPYWGLRFPYVFYFPATLFTALLCGSTETRLDFNRSSTI